MDDRNLRHLWNVRPSEEEGYARCYFTETDDGDQLEVDFNFAREMVKITLTLDAEYGRQYVALVKSGTILQERDITSRHSVDLTSRLAPFAGLFAHLPDEPLLRSLGGNYGLPTEPTEVPRQRRHIPDIVPLDTFNLFEQIRRYLRKKRELESRPAPFYVKWLRRLPDEIFDLGLGAAFFYAFTLGYMNIAEFAAAVGFLGVFAGAIDWCWRQRDPFLPKVSILLAASAAAVYYQVQYRMWAIFL